MNPMTPYLLWIKLGAAGLIIALAFGGGCKVQANRDAAKLAKKEAALQASETSLRAAAAALRAQNAANAERVKAAEAAGRAAANAGTASGAEEQRQSKVVKGKTDAFDRELLIAQRRAACKAWLDTNVQEVCGL